MLNNNEIKVLEKVYRTLAGIRRGLISPSETTLLWEVGEELQNIISTQKTNKKIASEVTNSYNKKNKERHRITNNIHNARKNNNQEKLEYWTKRYNELVQRKKED